MEISVGAILEGTIKSIIKFGAFVSLPGGRSGLVHISEIAHSYVANVSDFLSEGQAVKVKVVSIDELGRRSIIHQRPHPASRPRVPPGTSQTVPDFEGNRTFNAPTPENPGPPRPSPPAPPILRPGSSSSCRPLTAGCPDLKLNEKRSSRRGRKLALSFNHPAPFQRAGWFFARKKEALPRMGSAQAGEWNERCHDGQHLPP